MSMYRLTPMQEGKLMHLNPIKSKKTFKGQIS